MTKISTLLLIISGLTITSVQANVAGLSLTLPQVNRSALGYGAEASGAVSDTLFYTQGDGSVISEPASRSGSTTLGGLELGWRSDLICGNFDLKATVSNQLNGITAGFKNLMSDVIQGSTGAVASLPAMIIQRANPGLYDMLTNGVLQANVAFDKAQFHCQAMANKMMDFAQNTKWTQSAALQEYKNLVNGGDGDAVRVNNAGSKATGTSGHPWIGGQRQGGKRQNAIRPTRDLASADFNMMNQLPVLSQSPVSTLNWRAVPVVNSAMPMKRPKRWSAYWAIGPSAPVLRRQNASVMERSTNRAQPSRARVLPRCWKHIPKPIRNSW
ncbi:membrane protein, Tfp pilus assembly, pilus retraction ATPase PilT [Xenorhabdus budapestensis]|uniref:Membrane protein, Tfp pilus assembly, pilus retraction ATPase PilT n=1 Tax=Xenorhabdus budapestensis TaxID=290110 RepID=A0A2D0J017_XENBU|nr:membrane protein, Tfp pilus assembly, pilus retraction ATPase PilT [Xenorhabdus budapestensis]